MSLDPDAFRAVMGRFASGVTIVTATDESGEDHGMTVSAFASVSLEPPLIVVCIDQTASMHDTLIDIAVFRHQHSCLDSGSHRSSICGYWRATI